MAMRGRVRYIHAMSPRLRSRFDGLLPVSDRYANLPVADAFTWGDCAAKVRPGEWYMVSFRSRRKAGVDEDRLTAYDDWAHHAAMKAPAIAQGRGRRRSPHRVRRLGTPRGYEGAGLRPLLQGPDTGGRAVHVVLPV